MWDDCCWIIVFYCNVLACCKNVQQLSINMHCGNLLVYRMFLFLNAWPEMLFKSTLAFLFANFSLQVWTQSEKEKLRHDYPSWFFQNVIAPTMIGCHLYLLFWYTFQSKWCLHIEIKKSEFTVETKQFCLACGIKTNTREGELFVLVKPDISQYKWHDLHWLFQYANM